MHQAPDPRLQGGVVLLLMLLVLTVAGSSFLLAAIDTGTLDRSRHDDRIQALQTAKESLLAYAVHSDMLAGNGPGKLPCPDTANDGLPDCGAVTTTGRLPQQTPVSGATAYRFSDALAGIDQQFWYAVSPDFRIDSNEPVNTTTPAELTVNSTEQHVAVLIAPGRALANQTRPDDYDLLQYLEQENTDTDLQYTTSAPNPDAGNDIVLGITRDELLSLLVPRVIGTFRTQLAGEDSLPQTDAAFHTLIQASTSAPQWLLDNDWAGEPGTSIAEYDFDAETDTARIALPTIDECPEPLAYSVSAPPETIVTLMERDC